MQFTIWSHTIRRVITPFIGMALLAMPVYGQQQDKKQQNTVALSGSLIDSEGEPLIEATVKLLSARDSQFVKGTTTNFDGVFTMAQIKPGRYILTASYIGYEPLDTTLRLGRTANVKLKPILMRSSSIMLKEAVVHGVKTPIKVMEDTVEYNADSYHTQPNAVVEDLLKRLPGVEVGTDGAITANGKTVSKILIDGKEFFSDDPQVASKNLDRKSVV